MNSWADRAACSGADSSVFFPETRGTANAARALLICGRCTVKSECLQHALTRPENDGVWGGKTEQERRDMKPARKQPDRPPHGTRRGYDYHLRHNETPCGACIEGDSRENARGYQERQRTA